MRDGKALIFLEEDINNFEKARTVPKKKVVKILNELNITHDEFARLHRLYALRRGYDVRKISSERNNILRTLIHSNEISYKMYVIIMKGILRLNRIRSEDTYVSEDGKVTKLIVEARSY